MERLWSKTICKIDTVNADVDELTVDSRSPPLLLSWFLIFEVYIIFARLEVIRRVLFSALRCFRRSSARTFASCEIFWNARGNFAGHC
jgi:hypothetical protein